METRASQGPADEDGDYKERAPRPRSLKRGKLVFQRGLRSVPCIVRNLSENGAKLEFEQAFLLPPEFVLQIDLEDFEVTCEKRWADGLRCGVEFISAKRRVGKLRSQVLRASEQAMAEAHDDRQVSPDDFFARKRNSEKQAPAPSEPVRASRPSGAGKSGFGKRR